MLKSLHIYLPALLLLVAAIASPQMGRNCVGTINLRELCLVLAFWSVVLIVGGRVLHSFVLGLKERQPSARGFDVVPKPSSLAAEEQAAAKDEPGSRG